MDRQGFFFSFFLMYVGYELNCHCETMKPMESGLSIGHRVFEWVLSPFCFTLCGIELKPDTLLICWWNHKFIVASQLRLSGFE